MRVKDKATNITGTVAKPSKPSVRLTALEEPTIMKRSKFYKQTVKKSNKKKEKI